ncbi:MAG TPA: hypothetical protein PKL97_01725 [Candidatus Omnitrophota bacterium]|nr:hypothetical protein [Candidatus Omnitrophota bacterium]
MRKKRKLEPEKTKQDSYPAAAPGAASGQAKAKQHSWVDDVDWFGDKPAVAKSSS